MDNEKQKKLEEEAKNSYNIFNRTMRDLSMSEVNHPTQVYYEAMVSGINALYNQNKIIIAQNKQILENQQHNSKRLDKVIGKDN